MNHKTIKNVPLAKIVFIFVSVMVFLRALIYYHYLLGRKYYFFSDDAVYATLAKRFLSGDFLHAFHPYWNPGFPLASIPFYLITKSWENAQFLVSAISATLLIIVIFWFFKRFSLLFALIISFIVTFSASLQISVISGGITEPLYILLLWTSIAFSWLTITISRKLYYACAGIFFGLAYLTRTEVVVILCFFLLVTTLQIFFNKNNPKKKLISWITKIGLVLCFFFLLNAPYIIFQSLQLGRFTLSGKYAMVGAGPYYALEKNRPTTWAQDVWSMDYTDYSSPYYNPDRAKNILIKFIMNGTFLQEAKKTFIESVGLYKSEGTNNFFVGFGLYMTFIGFIFGILRSSFRSLTLYLVFLWFIGLLWVSFFMPPHYRYLVYALPFFLYLQALTIYASGWLIISLVKLSRQKWLRLSITAISIILPGLLLIDFFTKNTSLSSFTTTPLTGNNNSPKLIGEWLKSNKIDVFGGRMESILFYAEAKLIYMPSEKPEDIVKYMKIWGVEYLLVRPDEVGYAHVAPIANPKYQHPDLKLIKQFDDGSLVWHVKLSDNEKKYNERLKRE